MIRAFSFVSYVYRHPQSGQLYFRYTIPEKYRPAFGKREVKRSLRTTEKSIALPLAMRLYCDLQAKIQEAENSMSNSKHTAKGRFFEFITVPITGSDGKEREVKIDYDGDVEKETKAAASLLGITTKQQPAQQPQPVQESSEKLSKVAKLYCKERLAGGWREKTHKEYMALFDLVGQIIGNRPMSTITHADARKFKETLMKLPPNMTKGRYKDRTVRQIIAMRPTKTMAIKTINEKIGRTSSLFLWSVRHGYTSINPFEGLKLKDTRADHEQKNPYTQEELDFLFDPAHFNLGDLRKPFMFFCPLAALFSGARLKEIVELRIEDVQEEEGIPFFVLTEDARLLKNKSAARKVPIHPRLVELGFLDHVERQSAAGHERVFQEAYGTANGPGDKLSKWYRNYRRKLKVGELKAGDGRRKLDFHSFRHTFINCLTQQLTDERAINALVGHKQKTLAASTYSNPLTVAAMYPHLCKVNFKLALFEVSK